MRRRSFLRRESVGPACGRRSARARRPGAAWEEYAYDTDAPAKQAVAQQLLKQGVLDDSSATSAQVLGEFFHAVTRRIPQPMSAADASAAVDRIKVLPVVAIDLQLVERAIETHRRYRISYWDALIVAAAERANCGDMLSEDLNAGQRYHGIVVANPFAAE